MKFLDKMGLAIFSIIILIISIILFLIGLGWMQATIFTVLIVKTLQFQTATYILLGISAFLILLSVKCLFFSSSSKDKEDDDNGILLQNSDGQLLITSETIESMVCGIINEFPSIIASNIKVKINKENDVVINAKIDVKKGTIIKETTSKLQTRIKKVLKDTTDLEIKAVDVEVRQVEAEETETEEQDKE